MPANAPSILWFRQDLRLADNPALCAAIEGGAVIPVYIWAPEEEAEWPPGAASRWWLHYSLTALNQALVELGSKLLIRRGNSSEQLRALANGSGAKTVFWNRRYEPAAVDRDRQVAAALEREGYTVKTFNSALLFEPWAIANKSGQPFRVFTPFWKTCIASWEIPTPLSAPESLLPPVRWPQTLKLEELKLLPKIAWAEGIRKAWQPGELGARDALQRFVKEHLAVYNEARDHPGVAGTSRLSPHLHFGEISPRQICDRLKHSAAWKNGQFVTELGWREFGHHLLHHFPHTPTDPLRPEFKQFTWREDPDSLKAWQRGQTGYPVVDAGMRELWTTGWMHNRLRMIVASFLVKDLLQPWQEGARWFWDTLVDADLANNTLGWQWTAGCGADAMPYFRIFNPVSQGEKFDEHGDYVSKWVPELAALPDKWIHRPWEAPESVLQGAGVALDINYPKPMVSHAIAREVALEAFQKIRA